MTVNLEKHFDTSETTFKKYRDKPKRITQQMAAELAGVSLRTIERYIALKEDDPKRLNSTKDRRGNRWISYADFVEWNEHDPLD